MEVIFGLGLLGFLFLSVLGLFLSSRSGASYGQASVDATNLGERELYKWKAQPFAVLENLVGSPETYTVSEGVIDYQVEIRAQRLSTSTTAPEYRMLELSADLSWQQKKSLAMDEDQANVQQVENHFVLQTVVTGAGVF